MEKQNELIEVFEGKIKFSTNLGNFYILGDIPLNLTHLTIFLQFFSCNSYNTYRQSINLFNPEDIFNFINLISKNEKIDYEKLRYAVNQLCEKLEKYREERYKNIIIEKRVLTKSKKDSFRPNAEIIAFLKSNKVIENINLLLKNTGVVNNDNANIILFIVASSYVSKNPMHIFLTGKPGSGKQYLLDKIAKTIPYESCIELHKISSKSFFHLKSDDLHQKCIALYDFDKLSRDLKCSIIDFQEKGILNTLSVFKNKNQLFECAYEKTVANFSGIFISNNKISQDLVEIELMSLYEKIINDININKLNESNNTNGIFLQNLIRALNTHQVYNKYSGLLKFPNLKCFTPKKVLFFWKFCNQITLIKQYQRKKNKSSMLITTMEDVIQTIEILFDKLFIVSENERNDHWEKKFSLIVSKIATIENSFTTKDIQAILNISKTQAFRYITCFLQKNWIKQLENKENKLFVYQIQPTVFTKQHTIRNALLDQLLTL